MSARVVPADGVPLVRCDGAARTFGSGRTATVALQPTHCTEYVAADHAMPSAAHSGPASPAIAYVSSGAEAARVQPRRPASAPSSPPGSRSAMAYRTITPTAEGTSGAGMTPPNSDG